MILTIVTERGPVVGRLVTVGIVILTDNLIVDRIRSNGKRRRIRSGLRNQTAEGVISERLIPAAPHLHLGQTKIIRPRKLHSHISSLCAHRDRSGWIGICCLVIVPRSRSVLKGGGSVGGQKRLIRDEDPIITQPVAAGVGAAVNVYRAHPL